MHPALSAVTGSARTTLTANVVANLVRNVWTNTVIICGHFPPGIATFEKTSIEGETRGEWYVRQMLGSGNISGSPAMHVMTGNLSHQIEHHLFPDMPSNRYREIAPRIRDLMERNNLPYVTGSLGKQAALGVLEGRAALAAQQGRGPPSPRHRAAGRDEGLAQEVARPVLSAPPVRPTPFTGQTPAPSPTVDGAGVSSSVRGSRWARPVTCLTARLRTSLVRAAICVAWPAPLALTAAPSASATTTTDLAKQVVALVNAERKRVGCASVRVSLRR